MPSAESKLAGDNPTEDFGGAPPQSEPGPLENRRAEQVGKPADVLLGEWRTERVAESVCEVGDIALQYGTEGLYYCRSGVGVLSSLERVGHGRGHVVQAGRSCEQSTDL